MTRLRSVCLALAFIVSSGVPSNPQVANVQLKSRQLYGTIDSIKGAQFVLQTRDKQTITCDAAQAIKNHRTIRLAAGQHVAVTGSFDTKGILRADAIQRAKDSSAVWPADR